MMNIGSKIVIDMDVYDAIISRRSIRRFQQKPITEELLKKFVDAARIAPSAANLQPLEYIIINDKEVCAEIFKTIGWAGYIKPTWAPSEKERPTAYIVILVNDITNKWYLRDVGLASENILLMAESEDIGTCILCNVDRDKIRDILYVPESSHIDSVIALGYKAEHPVMVDLKDSVKYWRDENEVLHVPKRKSEDVVHINKF